MPIYKKGFIGAQLDEEASESSSDEEESEADDKQAKTAAKKKKEVSQVQMAGKSFERMPYPIIVDSGAAESVMPHKWCPHAKTQKGQDFGEECVAANGTPIRNKGEKVITMVTREGTWLDTKFQMCNVTRPLASVSRIVEKGHSVVFNPSWDTRGSYILNHETREKLWLTAKGGIYVLETKVAPTKWQTNPDFAGPGR